MKNKIKAAIIAVVIIIVLLIPLYCLIRSDQVVYTVEIPEKNLKISVILNSTDWPFGASHVSVYKNYRKFSDEEIHNDGKSLNEYNFSAEWDEEFIYLTMKGEEQADETISIPIN